ncbi:uncharacterized protein LOC119069225 [Bradysia coprophila]|uniref:uncharacterized protein LOC119069225 n=1 Tax=Bradysia coprophila TaxID=38358 RepID=UPI00187DB674|nr:uncharacterized protein LOC119069225 [Bradysia coprophila]XP_037029147.1 uncharacterized protein LOC119069225 [Bradysia coprophila]XP_037029148.1 uncharacterized protein LOC119069225 [Bradysia coprophila]XP_037029149.1 uncharacterized protein LOC119069225 [Bradysia coprophila]XP_037029150.1 uncharacterized protein LOC119069225 [Bradysia coprophila]XP_037029151.1 uncharacterized protein LOC119069225 [Bradysia coprophila]XP_037029152.1 uncharacterized protein LOC119069225 [Bradysia coprophil
MFQRKRKSGVYLHNCARFKTITKIIFILIISSVIAADSKCKLTSKETNSCDQPRLADDDGDNTKKLPHKSSSSSHHEHDHDHHHGHHHHSLLQLNDMKNSIYKYVNDMINTRTSAILANSLNQMQAQEDNRPVSETDVKEDMVRIEKFLEYLDTPSDGNGTSGRQLDTSEGRLFFFKGFKKLMWPVIIGVQVVKTVLLAMFLPSILGSLGKIVGKGLSTVSGFTHQAETVDDLEFKDNTYTSDKEQFNGYTYPQTDTSAKNNFASQMYDAATANNNAISRFGMNEQQMYMHPDPSPTTVNKPDETMMASSKKDDFKTFHDIPLSSMLLTNYDPFYSPLLSRLDAVFQQLGLSMGNEQCREKLVCLMYSSPAKFAPYSNLVSAQLSRELNELRKPTSDNPDILRFFKYMRAAKLGQDQANCDENFKLCVDLNENNPAMVTTYNDINKLVQARKL